MDRNVNNRLQRGLLLYHGSKGGISGEVKPISRELCDFGSGFYLGTLKEQAFSICIHHNDPHFYECRVDLSGLNTLFLDGMRWVFLVGFCRGGLEDFAGTTLYRSIQHIESTSDVIVGDIADDSIYPAFQDFVEGRLTDIGLRAALSMLKLGQQYTLKTEKACRNVTFKETALTGSELSALRAYDEDRAGQASSVLREVSRLYSRIGLTIDDYYDRGMFNETFESL